MAHVEWSVEAVGNLDSLIRAHSLPPDTRERVKRSLGPLGRFPLLGPSIEAGNRSLRFVLGSWVSKTDARRRPSRNRDRRLSVR